MGEHRRDVIISSPKVPGFDFVGKILLVFVFIRIAFMNGYET